MQLGTDVSAVVTGGASGLGAATARALAAKGVNVAILDLNDEAGKAVATEVSGVFARCDVTKEDSVKSALAAVRAAIGQERVLVCCAGIAVGQRTARRVKETGGVEPHDIATFRKVIEVNLIGTFIAIAYSTAGMMTLPAIGKDGERGVVVTTSSVAAEDGQIGQVAYAASKGGVASMALPVARDLSRDGIRIGAILPGLFMTPMLSAIPPEMAKSLAESIPFPQRLGDPTEYAQLAIQICENPMLNAVRIRLDGALRMAPR